MRSIHAVVLGLVAGTGASVIVRPAIADDIPTNSNELPQFAVSGPTGYGVTSSDGKSLLATHWLLQNDFRAFVDSTSPEHERTTSLLRSNGLRLDAVIDRDYHAQTFINFANSSVTIIDAWVEAKLARWARLRVGTFEYPITQERLTRGTDLPFISTSVAAMLLPARDNGVQLLGDVDDLLSYNLAAVDGAIANAGGGSDVDSGKDIVARVFARPAAHGDIDALRKLGLGVGASIGRHSGTAQSPELPYFLTYGGEVWFAYRPTAIARGWVDRVAPHLTWGAGPVALYADAVWTTDRVSGISVHSHALSAIATVVLTGEEAQPLGFVNPRRPFSPLHGGLGAIELVLGVGELAIDSSAFPTLADPTTAMREFRVVGGGANSFLTPGVAILVSYGHQIFTSAPGTAPRADEDTVVARVQLVL